MYQVLVSLNETIKQNNNVGIIGNDTVWEQNEKNG